MFISRLFWIVVIACTLTIGGLAISCGDDDDDDDNDSLDDDDDDNTAGDDDDDNDNDNDTSSQGCDGDCAANMYTDCTCGAEDPCGWAGDGYCDEPECMGYTGFSFDDSLDCD